MQDLGFFLTIVSMQDLDVSIKVCVVPWRLLHVPPVLVHGQVMEDGCIEAAENLGSGFRVEGQDESNMLRKMRKCRF